MTDRLNPEALEAAAKAARVNWSNYSNWGRANESTRNAYRDVARAAVSAYLAALPAPRTITTVEELDALPVGAVVYAANQIGPSERFMVGWKGCGSAAAWSTAVLARDGLPALVLWVPTEGGGE